MTLAHDPVLTHQIIGLAMRVHTRLGPGMLESAYALCLCREFDGIPCPTSGRSSCRSTTTGSRSNAAIARISSVRDEVILEIKSVERILPLHEAQLQTYPHLSRCKVGLLLNFNTISLKDGIRRRVL